MTYSLNRRQLLLTAGSLGLVSCAGTRRNSAFWSTVTGLRPNESAAKTRAYADSLPYASMLLWLDGQAKSLVVLGTVDPDQRLTWYTADKQAITTYGPFIVATAGTEVELKQTVFGAGWNQDPRLLVGQVLERQTLVARKHEATARLRSTFHAAGEETVKILGQKLRLERINESVIADGRVHFLNTYWIDASTGLCHKTRQQALPTMPPINTEILKFPATTT